MMSNKSKGIAFEEYCSSLFANCGCKVQTTPASGDYGCDLVINYRNFIIACQCKYYSNPVGVEAVQQVFSSMSIYHAHGGAVITNNTFTPAAHNLAASCGVLLIDGKMMPQITLNSAGRIALLDNWFGLQCSEAQSNPSVSFQSRELTMDDLVARYGLSKNMISQYIFGSGLPYYKVGRANVTDYDELKRWEIQQQYVTLGHGKRYYLPEWANYYSWIERQLKKAKASGDSKAIKKYKQLLKENRIADENRSPVIAFIFFVFLIIAVYLFIVYGKQLFN
jgi:hypothetical protein